MIEEKEVLGRYRGLRRETLRIWIERGWVTPEPAPGGRGWRFREIDAARVGLIWEFSSELAIEDDALDVVLPLIDQVHGLRHQLRRVLDAVSAEPEAVRKRIAEKLGD